MALKLRRGSNAQRLLITPAEGELIYTTDTKLLYVGDGTTAGGVAVDSGAATTFLGIASNITPDVTNTRNIGAVGNVYATGRFTSLFGNLTGNVSGNVTGNVTGNLTGNVDGNVTGDLVGSVFADDSSTVIDAIQKKIFGSLYSNVNGNLYVSVDPSNNYLTNGDIVMQDNVITLLNGLDNIQLGTNTSALGVGLRIKSPVISNKAIETTSLTDGTNADSFEIQVSRGTLSIPTSVQQGDTLFTIVANGYDGTDYRFSSAMFAQVETDTNNPVSPGSVPGIIGFVTSDDGGATTKNLVFNSFGELGVNLTTPTATLSVAGNASFNTTAGVEKVLTGMNSGTYTQVTSNTLETYTALTYAHAIYRAAKVTIHVHWNANDSYIGEFLIANGTGMASIQSIQSTFTGSNPVNAVTADISGANVRLRVQTPNTFSSGTVFKYEVHFTNFVAY
jgi:hypothetical protein